MQDLNSAAIYRKNGVSELIFLFNLEQTLPVKDKSDVRLQHLIKSMTKVRELSGLKEIAISKTHSRQAFKQLYTNQRVPNKSNPPATPVIASTCQQNRQGYLMSQS